MTKAKAHNFGLEKQSSVSDTVDTSSSAGEFVCACAEFMRSACKGLPLYKDHDGNGYCVLHYPSKEKTNDFDVALRAKMDAGDFNFRGVWFPAIVDFNDHTFTAEANFNSAVFVADAYFVSATFNDTADFTLAAFLSTAYFNGAIFNAADFSSTSFNAVDFISATFNAYAYFISTTFAGDADFTCTTFNAETSFRSAVFLKPLLFVKSLHNYRSTTHFVLTRFGDVVRFQECTFESAFPFKLDGAIFEKPDRVFFHTLSLRPHWFINVDPRKFNFANVLWGELGKEEMIFELTSLRRKGLSAPHHLLAIAYRQLSMNAEDNNRYAEATRFRKAAMLTRSLEIRQTIWWALLKRPRLKHLREAWQALDPLHSLYGIASGYGESVGRAALVLCVIWLGFAIGYWQGNTTWGQRENVQQSTAQNSNIHVQVSPPPLTFDFKDALMYSAGVITLQKPGPQPANKSAKILVLLETIMGPLQAALLALAIRRKFMR